jgi:hypothetical protein
MQFVIDLPEHLKPPFAPKRDISYARQDSEPDRFLLVARQTKEARRIATDDS